MPRRQSSRRRRRFFLHVGELQDLLKVYCHTFLIFVTSIGLKMSRLPRGGRLIFDVVDLACLAHMTQIALAASIPRQRVNLHRSCQKHVTLLDFDDITFKLRFRFRREHVMDLMRELDLLDASGHPKMLFVGDGEHSFGRYVRADAALLATLRRLSYVVRLEDLVHELSMGYTLLSVASNWMIDYIYDNYSSRLNRIEAWEDLFPDFADAIRVKCNGLFNNIIGFTDGHFQRIARPGGARNKVWKASQKLFYNRYYRTHGLKYIATVLANGIMLLHGAYAGKEHDSPCLKATGLVATLRRMEQEGRGWWMLFGDSAFMLSRHLQRMLKGLQRRTAAGKLFNTAMASVRVSVENAIGEVLGRWGAIGHKKMNRLGAMPLGRHVSVAVFLHNCEGILYGNLCTGMFGEALRESLTLSGYIARASFRACEQ